jgi:hypothetical protein
MKTNRHLLSTFALVAAIGLVGCGNDNDSDDDIATGPPPAPAPAPAPASVPDSAGISVAAFVSFLRGLSGTDETSEPLVIRDNFAVPADDSSEPTPLT